MQDKARAAQHYSELAWEAEHLDEIEAEVRRLMVPDNIAEAVAEQPDATLFEVGRLIAAKDDLALGALMRSVVECYMWDRACDAVHWQVDDPFEVRYCEECNGEIGVQGGCRCE